MLNLSELLRIYVCAQPTDMRKGFDSLAAVVRDWLGGDPLSGHLFVFRSRRGDRVKLLFWDKDGLVQYYKKFESHCPHFLLFTGIGRYRDNLAYRPVAAVGMDSNPPRIDPRRRPMPEEISVIVPPRAEFTAGR
jgi:transposase